VKDINIDMCGRWFVFIEDQL